MVEVRIDPQAPTRLVLVWSETRYPLPRADEKAAGLLFSILDKANGRSPAVSDDRAADTAQIH